MFHLADMGIAAAHWIEGSTHSVLPAFNPEAVLQAIERDRVTHVLLVPTMIYMLLDQPELDRTDLAPEVVARFVRTGVLSMPPFRKTEFDVLFNKGISREGELLEIGTNAGDLISEVALAIEMGADAADIGLTIHAHPTLSESIGMAAEMYEGTITDLIAPKKKH